METRANYALIGIFTLAVIASAFGFVFWFAGGDTTNGRRTYKVVFAGSVSGLLRGAPVLFNGVRVGDVTKIDLAPQDPGHVSALVDVDARVPVRTDTKARLESTGLTGVASVALIGGAEQSPPLPAGPGGGPGVIVAEDQAGFQQLLESARRISVQTSDLLDKTNRLMDDSASAIAASVKNVEKFSDALASNADGIKDFMGAMADVGKTIKPLTGKLETLATDVDAVVKAINPNEVKTIVSDVASISAKLNAAADKVDGVLTNLNGFLATGDSKGAFGEIAAAAKSIRKVADDFDGRLKEIAANVNRFTGTGLRQYEALAVDGRKTLEEINQAIRSIESNPQQFIFGKKTQIPEYTGSR
ncbi:MlaD family protein [Methylocapsa polymorpha]|uniref:MlaD family protein n=1 Tax=Methylocapsa polymorpha TaxID=3080828 RepID=A0ABZ0HLD9_9HYPH|nr:MlaD family protein [Methylocapsa sp. RX1]